MFPEFEVDKTGDLPEWERMLGISYSSLDFSDDQDDYKELAANLTSHRLYEGASWSLTGIRVNP